MKRLINITIVTVALLVCGSCDSFLDIVPDNVATLDNAYSLRTNAEKSLHTCYSYMPVYNAVNNPAILGCDEITMFQQNVSNYGASAWYIGRGFQTASNPYCDYWLGSNGGRDLYEGIRSCNIFLANIGKVKDLEEDEMHRWMDEVKFLKAYYHFYLTRMYGPIPIVDKEYPISASIEEVHVYRNTLDECFDYIVGLLDEILKDNWLPDIIEMEASELGRITNGIVKAFKAQVLIYAASPLFNGNSDYVGYADGRGVEIFCPVKTEEEKRARWQKAVEACDEAITFLESYQYGLYESDDSWGLSISDPTRYMMIRRGSFTVPENGENIWYYTNASMVQYYGYPTRFLGNTNTAATGQPNNMGAYSVPIETAALYYTIHGLPIDEDKTWDYDARFDVRIATEEDGVYVKPNHHTINFNMDREYRFYSDLAFDGASWFGNNVVAENTANGYLLCRSNSLNGFSSLGISNNTGYYPRKYVNARSTYTATGSWTSSGYYFPILSMRSLYLYYAEALNEIGAPYKEVLEYVDKIRRRSGVPNVEISYSVYSNVPDKYTTQEGLREIIHRERTIELMFEGERMWDQRRWKEALNSFNKAITGFNVLRYTDEEYYAIQTISEDKFSVKDYFWPIKTSETYVDPNLMQNPGW